MHNTFRARARRRLPAPAEFLTSPIVLISFLALGVITGVFAPNFSKTLAPIGSIYVDLLTMIALPFILVAIISGIQSLLQDPRASEYLVKLILVIVLGSIAAVVLSVVVSLLLKPGVIVDPVTRDAFGQFLSSQGGSGTELRMNLHQANDAEVVGGLLKTLAKFVPSNVFQALASGDTIKVLVFAILFGVAVARVPRTVSEPFSNSLATIYQACLLLTGWLILLLPFATYVLMANQVAAAGLPTLKLMIGYVIAVFAVAAAVIPVAIFVVAARCGRSYLYVLGACQRLIFLAVTTRSSVACIPTNIEMLAGKLGFRRGVVELVVPLQTVLLRVGVILELVIGVLFVAQLYERPLTFSDFVLLGVMATLLGLTSAGASSVVVVSYIGVICGYLGLPFEVAFALFVAVEAVTDPVSTLTSVLAVSGAAAAIAPEEHGPADPSQVPIPDAVELAVGR
jgi:Na+/H+-dicarboxylate symporter